MRSGDVALRFSIVFAVAGFITIAAGIYEIDRREKSSSETVTANLTEIEQRVRILSDQIRILNDQYTRQINANERELHALGIQIQALESRLNELEDYLRVRRESAPKALKGKSAPADPIGECVVDKSRLEEGSLRCGTSTRATRLEAVLRYRMSSTKSKRAARPSGASVIRIASSGRNKPSRRLAGSSGK